MPELQIPFVDLPSQHRGLQRELEAAFRSVASTGAFTLGEHVAAFEAEFAAYCGVEHCVGVASGTAALTLSLQAAGIGRGDEVIVPAHTFIATALAVVHAGATPMFCDVEDATGLIDAGSAEAMVTERTAAIIPVHLYGQPAEMSALHDLVTTKGLFVLEDAAQAHGATYRGKRVGSLGHASAFSFYPTKNLGALGDGGAICTDDAGLARRARQLRHLGQEHKGMHELLGWNERLDGLQAAFLRVKLPHLDAWNELRRARAADYRHALDGSVTMLTEREHAPCVYHIFPVRLPDREESQRRLTAAGIQTGVHYSPAVHKQPPFADAGDVQLPMADAWAAQELSLPVSPDLTPAHVARISELVLRTL